MKALIGGAIALLGLFIIAASPVYSHQSSISVGAKVVSLPPPSITYPSHNATLNQQTIQVTGHCHQNFVIKILLSGKELAPITCPQSQEYSLRIILNIGSNELTIGHYDNSGQPVSPSTTIVVFYEPIAVGFPFVLTPSFGTPTAQQSPNPTQPASLVSQPQPQLAAKVESWLFMVILLILLALAIAVSHNINKTKQRT